MVDQINLESLQHISSKGNKILIVGKRLSGKTTLANIIVESLTDTKCMNSSDIYSSKIVICSGDEEYSIYEKYNNVYVDTKLEAKTIEIFNSTSNNLIVLENVLLKKSVDIIESITNPLKNNTVVVTAQYMPHIDKILKLFDYTIILDDEYSFSIQ